MVDRVFATHRMTAAPSEFPFPKPQAGRVDVLIVAGEHSGDEQASRMVSNLLGRQPGLQIAALGGPRLSEVGAQLLYDLTASSVVGLVEVLKNFGFFRKLFAETLRWIREHQPRVVCFVDYPGFNLRLAKAMADAGLSKKGGGEVRAVYYISPQIWAWKSGRRFEMARTLDALAVLFPFEVDCYKGTDLPVSFVGHPFVGEGYVSSLAYAPDGPVLLLPGSREAAVRRIAPVLLRGFQEFRRHQPDAKAILLHPGEMIARVIEKELESRPKLKRNVTLRANDVSTAASAVLTSSGTMSLVCALAGIPGAIAYRTNPLTYLIARRLVKIRHIGIANLLLPHPMYPEFIQGAASAPALAAELRDCIENPRRVEITRDLTMELRRVLSQPPAGDAATWLAAQL
jgi:lipid-A-disaccharide synthase